jgi:DNA-binding NarL/FixJ family response regulator
MPVEVAERPITVLLVDFNILVREGLRTMLTQDGNFSILGEAPDEAQALLLTGEMAPDVVLTELRSNGLDGVRLTRNLLVQSPHTVVIILTGHDNENRVANAVAAGARGYMLMSKLTHQTLAEAIHLGMADSIVVDSGHIRSVLNHIRENVKLNLLAAGARSADLTDRELEVLQYLASGLSDNEIGSALGVSANTINRNVRVIVDKLGAGNRTRAAILAAQAGFEHLPLEDLPPGPETLPA